MKYSINDYLDALEEEYDCLSWNTARTALFDARLLYDEENGSVYSFKLAKEISIPDSTPVIVYNSSSTYGGEVLFIEDYEIVLFIKGKINCNNKTEFSSSVHELLRVLSDKVSAIDYDSNELVKLLLNGAEYRAQFQSIVKGQSNAINKALTQPITIIWGPPGTGKTYTLAEIAFEFYKNNNSVLIVSQSNIAVDNAMLEIKKRACIEDEGKIFRAGYSKVKEIVSKKNANEIFISARQYVEKTYPSWIEKLDDLNRRTKTETQEYALRTITESIRNLRRKIHSLENDLISKAKIIGTTISKATMDGKIGDRVFDVVLLDEASMAFVPQIIYSCSLAKSHFVCFGDFRQLPPIVQSSEKNILNKDIFDYLGIYSCNQFSNHSWLVMLNSQRRMHPMISKFVREHVYYSEIEDYDNVSESRKSIVEKGPLPNASIGFFNTDELHAVAISRDSGSTYSHFNAVSAIISVMIAKKAYDCHQKSISIIAPYRSQVNLIKALLVETGIPQDKNGITCTTIHQFQGRESDVIIFDSVDGSPMVRTAKMLQAGENSLRLINVAITRARGKFILVGSKSMAKKQVY